MSTLRNIVSMVCFKKLEDVVASHHGDLDLYNELETIAIDAPYGRQWVATGTATIQRSRSNGYQSYTSEACIELTELAMEGTEPASDETKHAMGW